MGGIGVCERFPGHFLVPLCGASLPHGHPDIASFLDPGKAQVHDGQANGRWSCSAETERTVPALLPLTNLPVHFPQLKMDFIVLL